MGFAFRLALGGNLQEWIDANTTAALEGLKDGTWDVHDAGKRELRRALDESELDLNSKTWRAEVYPPGRTLTWEPVVFFYSKAPKIIAAFDEGGVIHAKSGFMAVPLPYFNEVLSTKQRNQHSKSKIERAYEMYGQENLFVMKATAERPAILALRSGGVTKTGRITAAKTKKSGGHRKNKGVIPLFFLVSKVEIQKRLNVQASFDRIEREAPELITMALARHLSRVSGP